MRYFFSQLLFLVLLLFSIQCFSQTAPASDHPLLDKYYPRAKKTDTTKNIVNTPPPAPVQLPETVANPVVAPKPVPPPSKPVADTANTYVPSTKTVSQIQTTSAIKDTLSAAKTITATVQPPAPRQAPPPPKAPPAPYYSNRLGSSTPQYDTWEKNNNGAGSVTTSPK